MSESVIPPVLTTQYIEAQGVDRDTGTFLDWDLISITSVTDESAIVLPEGIPGSVKAFINDTGTKINLFTSSEVLINGQDYSGTSLTMTDGDSCIVWCVDQYNWFGILCPRSS